MTSASLFDLDQTLFRVNSSFYFGLYLCKKKVFSRQTLLYIFGCSLRHKLGMLSLPNLHQEAFRRNFLGQSFEIIHQCAQEFVNENFEKLLYMPAFNCLQEAKQKGDLTVLLSSSPDFLVEKIAHKLGMDQWHSTTYAVDKKQKFSKISHLMLGEDKARYIDSLMKTYGIQKNQISAFSDSYVDLPFLLAAGNPVGVNPDRKLRAFCKRHHWPMI